jgi:hypothetical protein
MTGEPASAGPPSVVRRSPTLLAFLVFVTLFGALFAIEIHLLFYRQSGVPAVARGDRPRLLGEVAGPAAIVQTFRMETDGLSGITVEARPSKDRVSGLVVFSLREIPAPVTPIPTPHAPPAAAVSPTLFRVLKPATQVVAAESVRVDFEPIEDSKGRMYQLRIEAPDVPAGQGIALWATRDQAMRGGVLTVNGREEWGDLVFTAHATRATLFRRIEYALRGQPAWLRSRVTLGFLIVLYNWALAAFTWYMLFVDDEPGDELVQGLAGNP